MVLKKKQGIVTAVILLFMGPVLVALGTDDWSKRGNVGSTK